MKNINIKNIVFVTTVTLILSACDGGGGNNSAAASLPSCGTATDQGKSVAIDVTGRTIQKSSSDAEVRIWHSANTKVACMIIGEAIFIN